MRLWSQHRCLRVWRVARRLLRPVRPSVTVRTPPAPAVRRVPGVRSGRCRSSDGRCVLTTYCSMCSIAASATPTFHSVRSDWAPARYPVVPGHEIVGRVAAVGSKVTKFRIGDIGGVGCMVNSCGTCENGLADREQNCLNGTTFTCVSDDRVSGRQTPGGYSDKMVVTGKFVIRASRRGRTSRPPHRSCAPASRPSHRCSTGRWRPGSAWASSDSDLPRDRSLEQKRSVQAAAKNFWLKETFHVQCM